MSLKKILALFLVLSVYSTLCLAQTQSQSDLVNHVAGVYRTHHVIEMFLGPRADPQYEKDKVEDILEIISYEDKNAYFKIYMLFDNAHICELSGIAEPISVDELQYKGEVDSQGHQCVLKMKFGEKDIEFFDHDYVCKNLICGARGYFSGGEEYSASGFKLRQKRKIRYLQRILDSKEYKEAVSAYNASAK